MSDERLRALERNYQAGDASNDDCVAYLRELLRTGKVTQNECVLAFRLARLEFVLENRIPLIPVAFDVEDSRVAVPVLRVLYGPAPSIFPQALSPGAVGDIVRSILMEEGLIPNPLNVLVPQGVRVLPQTHCQPGRHLGPINYDGTTPVCERCNQAPWPAERVSGCHMGLHDGPMETTTAGEVCRACGEVVTPAGSRP